MESDYEMSANVYTELLKKFEEAKIKLQQQTPVFRILNPPEVPTRKSEPKRSVILIVFFLTGLLFGVLATIVNRRNWERIFD